jgi:hypothetical protein
MGLFDKFKRTVSVKKDTTDGTDYDQLGDSFSNNILLDESQSDLINDYIKKFIGNKSDEEILIIENFLERYAIINKRIKVEYPGKHNLGLIVDNESQIDFHINVNNDSINDLEKELKSETVVYKREICKNIIENYKIENQFLKDIKRLKKLFFSKKIVIKYSQILEFVEKFLENKYYSYLEENFLSNINELKGKKLDRYTFFKDFFKQNVLGKSPFEENPYFRLEICKIGGFNCIITDVEELSKKLQEEIEIENFEAGLDKKEPSESFPVVNLALLDGYQFEEFLAQQFEYGGFKVTLTPKSRDQGADLITENEDGFITVIQAKKYDGIVSNSAIQEIVAAKAYYNADLAMVITTGYFSKSAIDLAEANAVILMDRDKLLSEYVIYDPN